MSSDGKQFVSRFPVNCGRYLEQRFKSISELFQIRFFTETEYVTAIRQRVMINKGSVKYKKNWLISSTIARELACFSQGDRLPTIHELTRRLHSSRGIIQKALNRLQEKGGVSLEKRDKMGTYINTIRRDILLQEGGLEYITATMPSPLSRELVSLASGICETMSDCPVPFNFAFIHSSGKRADALLRSSYDFIVTSRYTARALCAKYSELTILTSLDACIYSPKFVLRSNKGKNGVISPGDRIAADPNSVDQYGLTKKLCRGKGVTIIERPYFTCRAMLLAGEVDFLVYRDEPLAYNEKVTVLPIEYGDNADYIIPAIVINKNNYNIANILSLFISSATIAEGQAAVLENRREAVIF